jgi:hypothetical protein
MAALSSMSGAMMILPVRPLPRPDIEGWAGLAQPAVAVAILPSSRLRPLPRPVQDGDPVASDPLRPRRAALAMSLPPLDVVPRPPSRPDLDANGKVDGASVETVAFVVPNPGRAAVTGRRGSVCGDPAIKGRTIPPIAAAMKGCGLADGVEVTSIDGVALSVPARIDCRTALSMRAWVTEGLKPAVGRRGGGVEQILVAGSYACRPRNNQRGQQISEHGKGKALDITGFVLKDGEVLTVLRDWGRGKQGEILAAMHYLACNSFGTVLGPGANRFHQDHFHFDTARSQGSYCR